MLREWSSTSEKEGRFIGRFNFASVKREKKSSIPTINCTKEGCEDSLYVIISGFEFANKFCSGGRTVYTSKELRVIVTECEGDASVVFCDTEDSYNAEIDEMTKFYCEEGY